MRHRFIVQMYCINVIRLFNICHAICFKNIIKKAFIIFSYNTPKIITVHYNPCIVFIIIFSHIQCVTVNPVSFKMHSL